MDNTTLNPASGGDAVRTLDRTGTGVPKTEVVQLDVAGPSSSAESLVSAANPLPVSGTWDQIRVALLVQQAAMLAAQPQNGFVPLELTNFLAALANPGLYPVTAAELATPVTPVDLSFPPGNPRRQGAPINGITSARKAFFTQNSTGEQMYITRGTYLIDSNLTLSSNLRFESGAMLSIPVGVIVSITGDIEAGNYQIFSGAGIVQAGTLPANDLIVPTHPTCPEWWGAKGGSNDDTAAVQACVSFGPRRFEFNQNYTVSQITIGITPTATFTGKIDNGAGGAGTILTVTAITGKALWLNQWLGGAGITAGTRITALGSGTGGVGTYTVNTSQLVTPAVAMTGYDAINEAHGDFRDYRLIGNAVGSPVSVLDVIGGYDQLYNVDADANFGTTYQCAIHWYTYNLNIFYPGFNRFYGMKARNALIGLCIGALPPQSLPIPAQNVVTTAPNATDAPMSEATVYGFQNISCVRGIYMSQPNGKVKIDGGVIAGSHAGWLSYGASGYTNASTCALIIKNDVTQFSELVVMGGALEQLSEPTGNYLLINNGHLMCIGTTIEANCTSYFEQGCTVTFNGCSDVGWNFPGNFTPILIDQNCSGQLVFSQLVIGYPSAGLVGGTGSPFVKSSSNSTGTYATNVKGFNVVFESTELRDIPLAPLTGTSVYVPTVQGVQVKYTNSQYTSYNATPAITTQYDVSDMRDVLRGVIDQSSYNITAFGANGNAVSGGWAFTVGGASSWGSAASGVTQLNRVVDTGLKLTAAVGGSSTATSPKFSIEPQTSKMLRGWVTGGATGATLVVQVNWFKFDGTASSTANTVLFNGADTVFGATVKPFHYLFFPPKDATQAQLVLQAANGATMIVTDLSLK